MLEIQNSRERDMDDWKDLFEMADPRFKFMGGKLPPGSNLWFLEASWEGEDEVVMVEKEELVEEKGGCIVT